MIEAYKVFRFTTDPNKFLSYLSIHNFIYEKNKINCSPDAPFFCFEKGDHEIVHPYITPKSQLWKVAIEVSDKKLKEYVIDPWNGGPSLYKDFWATGHIPPNAYMTRPDNTILASHLILLEKV